MGCQKEEEEAIKNQLQTANSKQTKQSHSTSRKRKEKKNSLSEFLWFQMVKYFTKQII